MSNTNIFQRNSNNFSSTNLLNRNSSNPILGTSGYSGGFGNNNVVGNPYGGNTSGTINSYRGYGNNVKLGSQRVNNYDNSTIQSELQNNNSSWKDHTPSSIVNRQPTLHLSIIQLRIQDYYLIRTQKLNNDKLERIIKQEIRKGNFNQQLLKQEYTRGLKLFPFSQDINRAQYQKLRTTMGKFGNNINTYGANNNYNRNSTSGTMFNNTSGNNIGGNIYSNNNNASGYGNNVSPNYTNNTTTGYGMNSSNTGYGTRSTTNNNYVNPYSSSGNTQTNNLFSNNSKPNNIFTNSNQGTSNNTFSNNNTNNSNNNNNNLFGNNGNNQNNNIFTSQNQNSNNIFSANTRSNNLFNTNNNGNNNNNSNSNSNSNNLFGNQKGLFSSNNNYNNSLNNQIFGSNGISNFQPDFFNNNLGLMSTLNPSKQNLLAYERFLKSQLQFTQELAKNTQFQRQSQHMNRDNNTQNKYLRQYYEAYDDRIDELVTRPRKNNEKTIIRLVPKQIIKFKDQNSKQLNVTKRIGQQESQRSFMLVESKQITYKIGCIWKEAPEQQTILEGTIEQKDFKKKSRRWYIQQVKRHVYEKLPKRNKDFFDLDIIQEYQNIIKVGGTLTRWKVNLPDGYTYSPRVIKGFKVKNLQITNEFGKAKWQAEVDIANVDFSSQPPNSFSITKNELILDIKQLDQVSCNLTFFYFPDHIQRLVDQKKEDQARKKFNQFIERNQKRGFNISRDYSFKSGWTFLSKGRRDNSE